MTKEVIFTESAPAAIGPYSQAIKAGDFLFLSGQLAIDPATGKLIKADIGEQVHQVFKNIKAIAAAAGADLSRIVKTTVFLADINDFQAVNSAYAEHFQTDPPARSAFQVGKLPLNASVEIEVVIYLGE